MKRIFADTYFFIALLNARDEGHTQAREVAEDESLVFVTTDFVLIELLDGLCTPLHRLKALRLANQLRQSPKHQVLPFTPQLLERGMALYGEREDKSWSLTDCISFVVMRDEGFHEALTADIHFEQAGFAALMR